MSARPVLAGRLISCLYGGSAAIYSSGVFGIAILVAVFAGAGSYASPEAFSDGFAAAIAVSAALSAVGAIAGLGLPGRPLATGPARQPQPVPALETQGGG